MENTLRLKNEENLRYVFDLKGSTVDRKVKGKTKYTTTLKDVNFLMTSKVQKDFVKLELLDQSRGLSSIKQDVDFL